jgi:phosphatidylethanolamine/phosphatidyl-N-methylethanolamine N-methyltransferase
MREVSVRLVDMNEESLRRTYARWAPFYDVTFGKVSDWGRMRTVDQINKHDGRVLEVGVGTGISLPHYKRSLKVTAIDLSPQMLKRARERVEKEGLRHVEAVLEMDAGVMTFPDDSFDVVVAMYVLTVVPDPQQVMAELERVCRPGGQVIVVNHFSHEKGLRGSVEKALAPFARTLGWRPEFPVETILTCERLRMKAAMPLRPFGLFTMIKFEKTPEGEIVGSHAAALRGARAAVKGDAAHRSRRLA